MLLAFFIKIHFKINFWHLKNLILRVFLGSYSIFSFTLRETSCYDPRKHCMIWRFEILFEDLLQLSMWSSENHELPLDGQLHPMLQILHEYFSYGHQVPSLPFLQFSVKRLFSGHGPLANFRFTGVHSWWPVVPAQEIHLVAMYWLYQLVKRMNLS